MNHDVYIKIAASMADNAMSVLGDDTYLQQEFGRDMLAAAVLLRLSQGDRAGARRDLAALKIAEAGMSETADDAVMGCPRGRTPAYLAGELAVMFSETK